MGVFEQVFAKRGSPEAADQAIAERATPGSEVGQSVGVFEEVFVPRGRWRKQAAPEPEVQCEEVQCEGLALPLPDMTMDAAQFVVKNTFIDGEALDYDTLKDFLLERKVQSCPADCRIKIDEEIDDASTDTEQASVDDDVLKTASNYGDLSDSDTPLDLPVFNTASIYGDVDAPLMEAFNTASNYGDADPPLMVGEQHDLNGAVLPLSSLIDLPPHAPLGSPVDDTMFQDSLTTLRMRGTAIHRTILRMKVSEMNQTTTEDARVENDVQPQRDVSMGDQQYFATDQLPSVPWYGLSCEDSQTQVTPPPPPFQAAPMAPPVLRLAEAVAPPELGTPALPSIGSLLHHKRECKPCTFFHTRGCENKEDCQFCHLCGPGEKKKRLRQQRQQKRAANAAALENARALLASLGPYEPDSEDESDMVIE